MGCGGARGAMHTEDYISLIDDNNFIFCYWNYLVKHIEQYDFNTR